MEQMSKVLILFILVILVTAPFAIDGPFFELNSGAGQTSSGHLSSYDMPAEERYVAEFKPGSTPRWKPEAGLNLRNATTNTYEVTRYPNGEPDSSQVEQAWRLYNRSYQAADEEGYFNFSSVKSQGFEMYNHRHWVNLNYYMDNSTLDPERPESLVFYPENGSGVSGLAKDNESWVLGGYMYLVDGMDVEGRQVGGPLTVWHYHPRNRRKCFSEVVNEGPEIEAPPCRGDAVRRYRTPEMIHVWFVEHPGGPFASNMNIPYENLEPRKMNESEFKSYALESLERRQGEE